MAAKPSTPKGTRDFSPAEMRKRHYLFGVIRAAFERYGYAPIETPAMENLATLTGKYGEEGDQLLFKVLNNGDFLAKADAAALDARDSRAATPSLAKRGLRYDLTVPFARYVVQHRNDINLPFKRYAMQPVWRADRPQRGRYQEFYQCDADVVGSDSLVYEAELVRLLADVFDMLRIHVHIKVNHRLALQGLAEAAGIDDSNFIHFVTMLDKYDKIGRQSVIQGMVERGIKQQSATTAMELLLERGQAQSSVLKTHDGQYGLEQIRLLGKLIFPSEGKPSKINDHVRCTTSRILARGLSYYTGCIFEVDVDTLIEAQRKVKMGSIAAGGRYANLTEAFGGRDMSGVGISFGAERIYDVLEELDLWPDDVTQGRQVLVAAFGEAELGYAFEVVSELRDAGIAADCYPDPGKPKKPLGYADKEDIPYVILIGDREAASGQLTLKRLSDGVQESLTVAGVVERLKNI